MVSLPSEFVATKYPGYFWNLQTHTLFSIKSGVLRPLQFTKASRFNHNREGYRVSVSGQRRWLYWSYLLSLQARDSIIPLDSTQTTDESE